MVNTPQDNKELVWFVREVLMKKYPMPNLQRLPMDQFNFNSSSEEAPKMAKFIGSTMFSNKKSGFYFQSLTGSNAPMMPAPWLTESLGWGGCIVEPDPRKYFSYRKVYAQRDATKIVHASLSPQKYPKEVSNRRHLHLLSIPWSHQFILGNTSLRRRWKWSKGWDYERWARAHKVLPTLHNFACTQPHTNWFTQLRMSGTGTGNTSNE